MADTTRTTRPPSYEVSDRLTAEQADELLRLYRGEWWSRRRTSGDVARLLAGSDLIVALVEAQSRSLAAFARVVTDGVCLALILDVIVAPGHRGRGVGRLLMDSVLAQAALRDVVSVELVCQPELVPFYAKWGFTDEVGRSRLMRRTTDPTLAGGAKDAGAQGRPA